MAFIQTTKVNERPINPINAVMPAKMLNIRLFSHRLSFSAKAAESNPFERQKSFSRSTQTAHCAGRCAMKNHPASAVNVNAASPAVIQASFSTRLL